MQVEEIVETLLAFEEGVFEDVIRESSLELILPGGVLVSGAVPSQPLKQRPDDLDIRDLILGLEVVLCLVVPGVEEPDAVVQRVRAVDEVIQHCLVYLVGQ